MITWAISNQLARSPRPGYKSFPVTRQDVDVWLKDAKRHNIHSVICLLSNEELHDLYKYVGIDLFQAYRDAGFSVMHFPVHDTFSPLEAERLLPEIGQAYLQSLKPCLVHCNAGVERTGTVIKYLLSESGNSGA